MCSNSDPYYLSNAPNYALKRGDLVIWLIYPISDATACEVVDIHHSTLDLDFKANAAVNYTLRSCSRSRAAWELILDMRGLTSLQKLVLYGVDE